MSSTDIHIFLASLIRAANPAYNEEDEDEDLLINTTEPQNCQYNKNWSFPIEHFLPHLPCSSHLDALATSR